jgi:L-methionine (R)-S-oxide reductase
MNKKVKYEELIKQSDALIFSNEPVITALSNLSALIYNSLEYVSWCGFYLLKDKRLYLGPFQGQVACEFIDFGKGVCGTAAEKRETVIVPNVHEFPGHIACDAKTNSEIVIPVIVEDKVFGVFDLDSYDFSAFDQTDKIYLEKIIEILKKNVRLVNYQLI